MSRRINAVAALVAALAAPAAAFWRLPCDRALVTERADPIVDPGAVSGHVHTIMGGNGFGFNMTYEDTQSSTCSSCIVTKDFSNYWVPTLYYRAQNGSFISVDQVGGGTIYYLQRSDPADPDYDEGLLAFPEGFRMIAGNPFLRNYTDTLEQQAISFACLGTDNAETPYIPNYNCPSGLRAQVFFPSCWNGVDLDSDDHKSHMSYPSVYNAGHCPDDYPKRFISLFYEVTWSVNPFADMWYGDSHPFVFSTGDTTGYGYHGDFVNGWDVPTLQQAVTECTSDSGVVQDCPVFEFFDDDTANSCIIPPSVDEQVFGVLDALPGCNPVTSGPAQATPETGCGAPTTISEPEFGYVDMTSSGYAYLGCGTDSYDTTLTGASTSTDNMTVEYCINYCSSQGFTIAGLEYANQCYCGDSVPADRAPVEGIMGSCDMPCVGDDSVMCGGPDAISLYQKCSGSCENIQYGFLNPSIYPSGSSGSTGGTGTGSGSSGSAASSSARASASASASSSAAAVAASSKKSSSAAASTATSATPASASETHAASSATESASATETETASATAASVSASETAEPIPSDAHAFTPTTTVVLKTMTVVPVAASSVEESATGACGAGASTIYITVPAVTVTVTAESSAEVSATSAAPVGGEHVVSSPPSLSTPAAFSSAPYELGNGTMSTSTGTASGFSTLYHTGTGTGLPVPSGHLHAHRRGHKHY